MDTSSLNKDRSNIVRKLSFIPPYVCNICLALDIDLVISVPAVYTNPAAATLAINMYDTIEESSIMFSLYTFLK